MVWGYIQYGGAREICKVDSCLTVHSQLQEGSDFSTGWSSLPYLRFHYEVSQGEEDQGPLGMASSVSRYEYYWAYLGKNEGGSLEDQAEEGRRSFGMPARWPSMPSPTTSSTSSMTLCQTGWQLFCRPKEPIQDINYLTFSPWWNTRLIFHLLFYLLFEKDKMYWLLFDWLSFVIDFCPGRNWLVHHYQAINLISIHDIFCFDSIKINFRHLWFICVAS